MPKSYGKSFNELTEKDIEIIKRTDLTNDEICDIIGIHKGATLSRWRKKLGIRVPKGSKKGKPKPWQQKKEKRKCNVCGKEFEVQPARKKKLCSLECVGIHNKTTDKSYMQTESYKKKMRNNSTPAYTLYKNQVHRLSDKVYQQNKSSINPNNHPRTLCGVSGGYQLDHIITVRFGFDNNIPPEKLCEVKNLRVIPWKENLKRNRKSK